MRYRVEHADTLTAEAPFVEIFRNNLHAQGDALTQYRWNYVQNPTGAGSAFLLQCEPADGAKDPPGDVPGNAPPDGIRKQQGRGRVVGCCGLGRRTFSFHGSPIEAVLLGDFAVDRDHRTVQPALVLQRAIQKHVKQTFALAYGFPNTSAVAIFRRIGWREIGTTMRYAKVLRHGPYLARVIAAPFVTGLVGAVADRAVWTARLLRRSKALAWRMEWLTEVDPRFDALWQQVRLRQPLLGFRGERFLRWRFLQKPGERFAIAALCEPGSRRLLAYAVIQHCDGVAHVRDFLGASLDALALLLDRLVLDLSGSCDALSVRFLGAGAMGRLLLSRGFVPRAGARSVVAQVGDSLAGQADALLAAENWYLTDADEDV